MRKAIATIAAVTIAAAMAIIPAVPASAGGIRYFCRTPAGTLYTNWAQASWLNTLYGPYTCRCVG